MGIVVERQGGVVRVGLDRPERLNALDLPAMRGLGAVLDRLAVDQTVRCVVLAGRGRAFCAGADLAAADPATPVGLREEMMAAANHVVRRLTTLPAPVLAAVDGGALGVGASLALACDLVVASSRSYFVLPFLSVGLMPDGGASVTAAASMGRARAMRAALLGERISAGEAAEIGLIAEACDASTFEARVRELATRIAQGPRAATALTKQAVNAATLPDLDAALRREAEGQTTLMGTADFREGIAAFAQRRAPTFTD
ncbi:enoyl-CoA hydratase-related protein [Micromonospora sp. NPDC047465]|uniref:enoyl-CoA hydratase-related protein n=1 Tax=Micromonospora sp. NPDC047465 TaxID=3154813 RepID=UPI0033C9A366